MKILSLSNCPLDPVYGSGRTRIAWAAGLRSLGHEVTSVESIELMGGSEGEPPNRRVRIALGAWRWLRAHDLSRYDLIEFFGAEFWLATWWVAARRRRPVLVAHTDGLELLAQERLVSLKTPERSPGGFPRRLVRRVVDRMKSRLERLAFTRADGFVTASNADKEYLARRRLKSPAAMEVVLLGLEPFYHDLPLPETRDDRVCFLGSWLDRKGVASLVPVMTKLMRDRPALRLDLDGVGIPVPEALGKFPEEIRSRIQVRERFTTAQSIAGLSSAKVFFLPSEYEGFGLALAEGMACGCAAVTTPTGFGANLQDGREAMICGFGDDAAMTSAIRRLLDDDGLRTRVSEAGYRRVQELRWETSVRQLESIYQRWVDGAASGRVAAPARPVDVSVDRPLP